MHLKIKFLLFVILGLSPFIGYPQNTSLKIVNDPALDSVILRNIEMNKANSSMDGYRIQIFSGSERKTANALKTRFKNDFPDEPVYLTYQQPYFKLRIGDFRSMIEAQPLYHQLLKNYMQALIIPDRISFPKL
ncbi:MAG: SPOR domain-containing protein [Bacteroidia bacterium]|nr:SPOR domain-containing protein [Bacteroidia bacterium]